MKHARVSVKSTFPKDLPSVELAKVIDVTGKSRVWAFGDPEVRVPFECVGIV
jgi:hypothetical protein